MKLQLTILMLFACIFTFAQSSDDWKKPAFYFNPEILLGLTMESNDGFPETKLQKQLILNFGRTHANNPQAWAKRLRGPTTGLSFGVTDYGNLDSLGISITAMPFIEFKAFGSERWKVLTGMGASYFTKQYNAETNPKNQAVTTDITWAFRMYLYYHFLTTKNIDWRMGLGYSHHSNGHMRLLNQGYNSFLVSFSAAIKNPMGASKNTVAAMVPNDENTTYNYFSVRSGLGQNVFALAFNDKRNVYTVAGEYGQVYNNTFKIGIGLYYRFYQHYYDYIAGNESLVQAGREFDYFRSNPWYYASNVGITVHGEIFLNHFGIDVQLGYNLHKPAYKIDWRINQGWDNPPREIPRSWVLGEYNSGFKKKSRVSSRLGLKYYLIGMEKAPKNNFYIGAHLKANLGQADFSELSFGYVHSFNHRLKP
ncbi:acyloxyacyl hydrolase [Aequorivita marisscotiae]|uniref:Acyloxyacyl hydrolase n=1 Tax=Aequorivita marisscotiae TaxID=3040348 RepID=A0ABY8KRN3_9FLAO|nr:acyloxyacyl hydrolase [Aequorivita sp. Ant34-E75]WGF92116.1 acyloxyacyl hydrolase [Aequorivita sp. Ant34-E75]